MSSFFETVKIFALNAHMIMLIVLRALKTIWSRNISVIGYRKHDASFSTFSLFTVTLLVLWIIRSSNLFQDMQKLNLLINCCYIYVCTNYKGDESSFFVSTKLMTVCTYLYLYKYENVYVCLFAFLSAISKPIGTPFGR